MPALIGPGGRATNIFTVDLDIGEYENFKVCRKSATGIRAGFKDTRLLSECYLLLDRHLLFAKVKNSVFKPTLTNFCNRLIREFCGYVDPGDFCSQRITKWYAFDAQERSLCLTTELHKSYRHFVSASYKNSTKYGHLYHNNRDGRNRFCAHTYEGLEQFH